MEGALLWVAERRAVQGCSQTPPPRIQCSFPSHCVDPCAFLLEQGLVFCWWPEPPQPIAFLYDTPPSFSHCWEFNLSEAGTL